MQKGPHLQTIPYFAELAADNPVLTVVARDMVEERYEANQVIFLESEPFRGLFYVVEGRVRIYKSEPSGREQVLNIVMPGATFNDVPLFDGKSVPANAAALEPSLVWIIPTATMRFVLDSEPQVAQAANRILAARLRQLTTLIGEISLKQVTARVAKILVSQVEQEAILGTGISTAITNQLTQQQMAAMAGTVREMVGRALRTLQKQGAIEARRGHIIITDMEKLRTFLS